nr:hypothetical protein [Bacillota bacterium]
MEDSALRNGGGAGAVHRFPGAAADRARHTFARPQRRDAHAASEARTGPAQVTAGQRPAYTGLATGSCKEANAVERSVSPLWSRELADLSACRPPKPRQRGLTMVLDKGMGLAQFADWLQTVGDHVDIVKLGFGTAALYPIDVLQRKIRLAAERGVQ